MDYRTSTSAIFGRYSKENPATTNPGYLPAPAIGGGPGYPGLTLAPGNQVVLGYGRSIGATKYYEIRVGFSRLLESIIDAGTAFGNIAEKLGIPNANAGGAPGLTNLSISGTAALGDGNGSVQKVNNLWEVDQAFSWVKSSHELKFGFNWMSTRFAFFTPPHPNGTYSFNGSYTGYGLADFLYGRPISSQVDVTKFFDLKRYRPTFYVQDNWRVTSKLTLNLGLRDELVTPWKERHNRLAVFDPSNGGNLVPVGTPGFPGDSVTDGRYTNVAPRAGFAYSFNPKTVIRGGFGMFYPYETYNSNPQSKNASFKGRTRHLKDDSEFHGYPPVNFPASLSLLNLGNTLPRATGRSAFDQQYRTGPLVRVTHSRSRSPIETVAISNRSMRARPAGVVRYAARICKRPGWLVAEAQYRSRFELRPCASKTRSIA